MALCMVLQAVPGFWHTQWAVLAAVWQVLQGPERRAVRLALVIAFIDQAMASTAVVNYAPEVCITRYAAASPALTAPGLVQYALES